MVNAFATWAELEISELRAWVQSVEKGESRHHIISPSGHREDITDTMLADKKQRIIELEEISVALARRLTVCVTVYDDAPWPYCELNGRLQAVSSLW